MPTFERTLEQVYLEVWMLKDRLERLEKANPKADHRMAHYHATEANNIYLGAMRVLGTLLQMDGQVGMRFPASNAGAVVPDPDQTYIRLIQWAVASGRMTRGEYERIVGTYPSKKLTAAHMGDDFEPVDPVTLPAGSPQPDLWPVGYRPV